VYIDGAAASGIFTRCIFKSNTAGNVSEDAIIKNISLSIFIMFSSCCFLQHQKSRSSKSSTKKNKIIKWDCFVYGCPSLFNLFHLFWHFYQNIFWCNNWSSLFFLLFVIFSFTRQSSSSFSYCIWIISYYVDIYFYISTILLSLSLVSLSSLNSLVVQWSSIMVLVHLQPAPSLTIQLPA